MSDWRLEAKETGLIAVHEATQTSMRLDTVEWELGRESERRHGTITLAATPHDGRVQLTGALGEFALDLTIRGGEELSIAGSIRNPESSDWRLQRLTLRGALDLGKAPERGYHFLMNGFQSWTASHSFAADESERVPIWDPLIEMQDNLRNRPDGAPGRFRADIFGVVGNLDADRYALFGQAGARRQLVYVRTRFASREAGPELALIWDFDGRAMRPGETLPLDEIVGLLDSHANRLLDRYTARFVTPRAKVELPAGWCSWYHYYTKVKATDILANLDSATKAGADWNVFVLDDGYMTAVGDWESPNAKFPQGTAPLAAHMEKAGFRPGIWLAPFIARSNSSVFRDHKDWFLKDKKGKPLIVGYNPLWGMSGLSRYYGLDITHPEFQTYLRHFIRHAVKDNGFRYLKLDFLYAAMLTSQAYDPCLSPAERLGLGLDIIREEAGDDVVILGCGCPLAPAIGRVEAMRIGPDVAPFWEATYRYKYTRDPHALCTKFALRSILVRTCMHRHFWVNDPDCMMLRAVHTKLTAAERRMLVDAVAVTGGMPLLSDDLSLFDDATWALAKEAFAWARQGDTGRAWALDIMEHAYPRFVYNSAGLLCAFNFEEQAEARTLSLARYLTDEPTLAKAHFIDATTGASLPVKDGVLDFGTLGPHASRLVRIER